MAGWCTFLFVSCMAGRVAGLLEPLNVQIESRNFSLFLTWLPAQENPSTVTYEVQYSDMDDENRWTPVPACENISITECDFTCALMKFWDLKHTVQVRTVSPSTSSWVQIQNIEYMFTVDPDPPNLTVTQGDGSVTIDMFIKKALCVPQSIFLRSLKYFVVIRRKYNPEEVVLEQELDGPSITKKSLGYNGEYCVAAKTRYTTFTTKESAFSPEICLNFTQNDVQYHTVFALLSLTVVFGSAAVICVLIWCTITVKSKKPKALDFASNKHYQKYPCTPDVYLAADHSLTFYSLAEQDSSTKTVPLNKHVDGVNIYPRTGQGYLERPSIQTSIFQSQEYFSSKSSSGFTCQNTSGSVTDMLMKAQNNQTDDCLKEIKINVSEDVQMFSTAKSVSNPFDSLSILGRNSIVNVPFDTLCIGGNSNHKDYSGEESGNQCFTDSEDGLDSLITDDKMSNSKYPSQDEKTHDCCSGYTQRTLHVK